MKRKWKILLACVVVVAAVAAMTVGICARYVLHYPAVGGDFEISFIRAGETLEDITRIRSERRRRSSLQYGLREPECR